MSTPATWSPAAEPAATDALVSAGIDRRLAILLARRGVADSAQARAFLDPSADDLHDPARLLGMRRAVERLLAARDRGERLAVVGDYDVDGVTGSALLTAVFRACGLDVVPILPNRLTEGYGFRGYQVERAIAEKVSCIVTVDCGVASHEAILQAAAASIDVVVTDHHIPKSPLPPQATLINPRQPDCSYPFKDLAGVGLALKLAQSVAAACQREISLQALLRIAALGTIADIVPLRDENRIIAALGLRSLRQTPSFGLQALFRKAGMVAPFRASDIGFRIGPRINAVGRLRRPDEALELLLSRDPQRAERLADELEECNRERQAEELKVVEEADRFFAEMEALPNVLVAWSREWHRGVVGIAASRMSKKYHRPCLLLAEEGDTATGSGRSISGIDLHAFFALAEAELVSFGGHTHAVGMTVASARLEDLRRRWTRQAEDFPAELLVPHYDYELELTAGEINDDLVEELNALEPHGAANAKPLLRVSGLRVDGVPRVFGRGHLKAHASDADGRRVLLKGWGWEASSVKLEGRFDILARLDWDRFEQRPVLELIDARPAS